MSAQAWTRGDWYLEGGEIKAECCPIELAKVTAFNEGKANGRLMAASPDLYEALEDLVTSLRVLQFTGPVSKELENARAALARARGEQP